MSTLSRQLEYEADGARMIGTYFLGEGVSSMRPGILVAHSGPGLAEQSKTVAGRLAEHGYAAFALDYHGGGVVLADMQEMMSRINGFLADPLRIRARLHAALQMLLAQPEVDGSRLGAIGYCFGGTAVLELARSGAPVAATVGFHSGLKTVRPRDAAQIHGKVLVCLGAEDPLIAPPERNAFEAEMGQGGVDWQMHVYGGAQHSFTEPGIEVRAAARGFSGMKYNQSADRQSWRSMLQLFEEVFRPSGDAAPV
jgi:dienelactone hydrolase